jgi:hypothetical protein
MEIQPGPENKRLDIGAVAYTKARTPKGMWQYREQISIKLSEHMLSSGFLSSSPFNRIGIIIRYGLVNEEKPHYSRMHKDGYLPLAIEIDTHDLLAAKGNDAMLYTLTYRPVLLCMISVAKKYKLDSHYFESELAAVEDQMAKARLVAEESTGKSSDE